MVYSHLNYGIWNWATANWSRIADLVMLYNRAIRSQLKVSRRERIPFRDLYSARMLQIVVNLQL